MKTEPEPPLEDSGAPVAGFPDIQDEESAENFQKFMLELFEKNGILNDLRAYLRGHIVNVLRSAQTGDVPSCTKHFTQRLELPFQALNILIAEYFLRMDLSYSLSVFASEIPLANMVFEFAKSLMQCREHPSGLNFKQSDIWSILNYLDIKCDSEHATNIVEMYKSDNVPLLLCILKCTPMYKYESMYEQGNISEDSLSSVSMASEEDKTKSNHRSLHDKCRHTVYCKSCRSRILRIREGYKKKKRTLVKTVKETNLNSSNVECFMNNISNMERGLIDEMFDQLKTVYESEMEMLKAEEDKKVKRSLASHSLELRQQRDEMEESFKAREEELENNLQQKKKFLWGLARALREQHAQVSRAQVAIRHETKRLSAKEETLQNQLIQAEQALRKRGEEMRTQISNELVILESHLESMKRERDNINRERSELEHLKNICDTNSNVIKIDNLECNETRNYDSLKNELNVLRKFLESTTKGTKCFIERSTLTELNDVSSRISIVLNNEQDSDRNYSRDEERGVRTPNLVVNDFKKQKNVNFSQSNLDEIYRERSRDRSRSSASSEAGDAAARDSFERDRDRERDRETIRRLRDENERLKGLSRQQREHAGELWSQQQSRQTDERRAHTAPAAVPTPAGAGRAPGLFYAHSVNQVAAPNTYGWRKGAGEELSLFSNVQPRIVLPGDTVPFIGVMRDRHGDNRRHLISQWRALRRRMSPVGVGRLRASPSASPARDTSQRPCSAGPSIGRDTTHPQHDAERDKQPFVTVFQPMTFGNTFQQDACQDLMQRPRTAVSMDTKKLREKSPKSLLREAKEKLRNSATKSNPATGRDKSPNAVLREAKLRLRKLEIEAEAVERSYRDFRRRQAGARGREPNEEAVVTKDVDHLELKRSKSLQKLEYNETAETSNSKHSRKSSAKTDFDKYIREYQSAFETHFVKNNVNRNVKPIPESYSLQKPNYLKSKLDNFLDTPLVEFRNLYQSQKPQKAFRIDDAQKDPNGSTKKVEEDNVENNEQIESKTGDFLETKNTKADYELEILKHNLKKIYNKQKQPTAITEIPVEEKISSEKIEEIPTVEKSEKNLLRIEVETSEIKEIITESEPQNLLLVVETTVNEKEIESESEGEEKILSANMTILISPKRSLNGDELRAKSPEKGKRSVSPEQAARLTRNDVLDAIFHTDNMKEASSIEMQLEISKENDISEVEKPSEDYIDDFSADVDNYNTRSVYENHSPISIQKTEEDSFWDS